MGGGDSSRYELYRGRGSDQWGFKITTLDNHTYITGVYECTPAAKAGLKINEIVVTINRVPCALIYGVTDLLLAQTSPPKNSEDVENRHYSKPKKSSEKINSSPPKENVETREKSSSKHRSKSMTALYEINVEDSQTDVRRRRTKYEQKKRQSHRDSKMIEDRLNIEVPKNGTKNHAHLGKSVDRTESTSHRRESNNPYEPEADMTQMENCRSSAVLQQQEAESVTEQNPPFPSMSDLQRSLPAGKRRTLLLNTGKSLEDRIASLNDL
ncbi:unnamed protein product [Hydatigera taeniaeformis]|uniref:PDZ domain-containing protein n=1 Tax=Hydatigena taeniaeformis TaxID=6205 RepID=A0A0R3WJQ6_HYDTA|nr:unnamed protein product [Hydatigera taeniaeformis]